VARVSQDTKVEALKRLPLFEGLSKKELTELARRTEDLDFGPGKVLCEQGDVGTNFFVILEGEVEVTQDGTSRGTRSAGDFFGEIALVEDVPRTATVTAKTQLRFFVLSSKNFQSVLDQHPAVERKVLRTLVKRLATDI
jgi:CRP-like cAMP-binding protein